MRKQTFSKVKIGIAAFLAGSLIFAGAAFAQFSGFGFSTRSLIKVASNGVSSPLSTDWALGLEMAAPSGATSSLSAGGSLTATTSYFYVVTALDGAGGESLGSNETRATTTSANKTITVSWTGVTGAASYKVYRATSSYGYAASSLATTTASVSFADNGVTLGSGRPPSEGTALVAKIATSSASWFVGGNVGIGTTTPSYSLDVVGTARVSATSTFSGRVGIGTASPSEALTLNGNIAFTDNTGNRDIKTIAPISNTNAASIRILPASSLAGYQVSTGNAGSFTITAGTAGDVSNAQTGNAAGNGGILTLTAGNGGSIAGEIEGGAASAGYGGNIAITAGAGGNMNGDMDGSGGSGGSITLTAGNGGIFTGTTSGEFGGYAGTITIRGGNGGYWHLQEGQDGGNIVIGAGDGGQQFADGGNVYIYGGNETTDGYDGNVILAYTENSVSQGKVGINTNAPSDTLDVSGAIRVGAGTFVTNKARLYTSSILGLVITGQGGSSKDFTITESGGDKLISNPAGTKNVILAEDGGGKVGIGTSTPGNPLVVVGTSSFDVIGVGTSTPNSTLQVHGNFALTGSSTVLTSSIGGSALLAGACALATSTVDSNISSSTAAFVTTPQIYPGDGTEWFSYLSGTGIITTKVCALVAVTPTASQYVVKIIK